jgi:hypothetical protein
MIHRRLYCYAVLREFSSLCTTPKPNIGIDTESHIGLFDACPCLLQREHTTTRAGRRWTSLEGGNRGVDRRGGNLRRLWGLKGTDRQPCHGRLKQIRVGMMSKVASEVSCAML